MKLFLKISTWVAGIAALVMWAFKMAESFSQNELTDNNPFLRTFLIAIVIASTGLAVKSGHKLDTFRFNLLWPFKINWTIQWQWMYAYMVVSFALILIFDVYTAEIPHIIATGTGTLGAYIIAWNYFKRGWQRVLSIGAMSLAVIYFLVFTYILKSASIASGEMAVVSIMLVIFTVITNEQIPKK